MDNWISVEDRLPKKYPLRFESVIVHKSNGVRMEAYFNSKTGMFVNHKCEKLNHDVTDWQPLPEPPESK